MSFSYDNFSVTKNFKFDELVVTSVKSPNYPSSNITLFNLYESARKLQRLRDVVFHRPVVISSGFRSFTVNRAVGGVMSSDHCKGFAFDIKVPGMEPYKVFMSLYEYSKSNPDLFGQVICYPTFVHVSFNREKHVNDFFCKDLL